ncbi:Slp family lipoprotein [Xanthomonadaceae bacterium JHOS43]|nr:Slp family lipoprotein [Xanthomonadaceae bacterium JHOS43]
MIRPLILLVAAVALTGCVTPPKPLRGTFAALAPGQAAHAERAGDIVRWGGRIISVEPTPEQTCIEILGRDLSGNARPVRDADHSQGRFLACRHGFYDPAIFTTERDVTVTGQIVAFETRRIGEFDYRYPRVAAETIYLWPQQVPEQHYHADPFWPGYAGWGWGFRHPPVIVRTMPKAEKTPPPSL